MNATHVRSTPHGRWHHRHAPLAAAIMAALLAQAPAFAQEAEAQADSAQAAAPQPADSPTELDAVVVTAQGREADILAVPYNISVVSGEALAQRNILDTAELMGGVAEIGRAQVGTPV